jgi:hypothetical protein
MMMMMIIIIITAIELSLGGIRPYTSADKTNIYVWKFAGSIPDGIFGIFIDIILPSALWLLGRLSL